GQFLSATPPQGTTFAYSVVRFTAAYDNALTHEYAETATDPFLRDLKGWTTAGQEQEIADLCEGYVTTHYQTPYVAQRWGPLVDLEVALLWDNASNGCMLSRGLEYWSSTTGKHTVQGAILTQYSSLGGPGSPLGSPTTEEETVSGQRVSYFEHG